MCSFLLFSINQAYDTRGAFGLTRSVERLDTGRYRHHGATTINYRSYLLVQGKDLLPTEKNITETMNLTGLHQSSRKISEVNHSFGFFFSSYNQHNCWKIISKLKLFINWFRNMKNVYFKLSTDSVVLHFDKDQERQLCLIIIYFMIWLF